MLAFHAAAVAERAFDEAVERRLALAARFPRTGRIEPDMRHELRWHRVGRFPYSLLIATLGEQHVVVAVAHHRRQPGYRRNRLGER